MRKFLLLVGFVPLFSGCAGGLQSYIGTSSTYRADPFTGVGLIFKHLIFQESLEGPTEEEQLEELKRKELFCPVEEE